MWLVIICIVRFLCSVSGVLSLLCQIRLLSLAWASGVHFENRLTRKIVYCSLVLAMTQVCGLEATIEGMKVTSQRRLTISKPLSPNVVFVC